MEKNFLICNQITFSVFWDSLGENFAIDKDTRKQIPSIILAGAQFIYKPEDKKNTFGRVQATGPTERKITVYVSFKYITNDILCEKLRRANSEDC